MLVHDDARATRRMAIARNLDEPNGRTAYPGSDARPQRLTAALDVEAWKLSEPRRRGLSRRPVRVRPP